MSRIIYLMGKSSTGKDTIFKKLLVQSAVKLKTIVPYTTRPIRRGEKNGVEYFFTDEESYQRFEEQGQIIEARAYETYHGIWRYFMVDDGQIQDDGPDYIMIGTLGAYRKLRDYFGAERLLPVLIELDDGQRLQRALNREMKQEKPKYEELCRRFLADSADFSEEKIAQAGIEKRFENENLEKCLKEILEYIQHS